MAVAVSHATQATLPNDATKEISSDAWNEEHTVTGLGGSAVLNVGTAAGTVAAGDHTHNGLAPTGGTTGQVLKKVSDTNFDYAWDTDETAAGGAAAWGDITGTLADQTDLQDELDAKASLASPTFTGTVAGITKSMVGLGNVDNTTDAGKPVSTAQQTALDLKANLASPTFTGTVAGITKSMVGLGNVDNTSDASKPVSTATQTALDAKQPLDTDLTALAGISGADGDIIIRTGGAWTKLAKGTDGHVLTLASGVPSWASAAGGSDPWTYQVLAADFTTSSTTVADVTNGELLGFAPAANTKYLFEGQLMLRTATATVNPRLGFAWATGLTDGVVQIEESQSATAQLQAHGNINAAVLIAVGGLPNTTQSWPAYIWGTVVAGATPSGNCRVQLSTETAGTIVRVVAGSWFRFRSYT